MPFIFTQDKNNQNEKIDWGRLIDFSFIMEFEVRYLEGDSIKKLINIIFIVAGFLSLGIGLIGIVLPVVPTTPLLLLASFCFMKGSKKFEAWFKGTKIYIKYLEDFVINKWMTLKQKVMLNLFADCMIAIGFFAVDSWIVRCILILAVIFKYYYFITKIETRKAPK